MFPFSSETKNMGIIIEHDNMITYYLKGADAVMKDKIPQTNSYFMM